MSVTMRGQRGYIRVWRITLEVYDKHCIRCRWKGFKEFMFWGCFSYNKKNFVTFGKMRRLNKAHGKLVRDSKEGIDWYRYYKYILEAKLLPLQLNVTKNGQIQLYKKIIHLHMLTDIKLGCMIFGR